MQELLEELVDKHHDDLQRILYDFAQYCLPDSQLTLSFGVGEVVLRFKPTIKNEDIN